MKKKETSWLTIILVLIIFWPVGLYMVYKKFSSHSKTETYKIIVESVQTQSLTPLDMLREKAKKRVKWSYILIGLGIIFSLGIFRVNNLGAFLYEIIMVAIFAGSGFLLLQNGKKMNHIIDLYEKYYPIIINSSNGKLNNFASAANTPVNQVISDLNELLNMKLLGDSYLDQATMEFHSPLLKTTDLVQKKEQSKPIKCPNCGGMNLPMSGHQECEYCGTVIGSN